MKSESRKRTSVGNRHTTVHVGVGFAWKTVMIAADKYMPSKNKRSANITSVPSSTVAVGHRSDPKVAGERTH
jgi:hypothetical protein